MAKQLIYDLPTRIFHWLFSGLFVMAFVIAETVDDENLVFSYHMLAGLILGGLVALRIIWGFIGSYFARFSSFELRPGSLIVYAKGIMSGDKKRWPGHNPASSWVTLIMLGLALMLALSGILMTTGYKEEFEDMHELFANAFLIAVIAHIAGILLHSIRHKDGIAFSMIHGKKKAIENSSVTVKSRSIAALVMVIIMALLTTYLTKNFNTQTKKLNMFGIEVSLES